MEDKFIVTTDKKEKIKLESRIVAAEWLCSVARGGAEAKIRVKTVFVAEGSPIEIKGCSSEGKAPDTIKGKVFSDEFRGKLLIPEKVKPGADIWFEAKLPKHGCELESDTIPAKPPILAKKICWDREEAHRGDEVLLTCQFESGVTDGEDATFVIYEHNPNSYDFKVRSLLSTIESNKAEAIWAFDYDEDTAQIATNEDLKPVGKKYVNPQYYFVVGVDGVGIGEKRESGILKFKDETKIKLVAWPDHPLANVDFTLELPDGTKTSGRTDSEGTAIVNNIPPGRAKISVAGIDEVFTLNPDKSNTI